MFDKRKIAQDFSRAAAHYGEHADMQKRIGESLITRTIPHMNLNASLLDVGAGSGEVTLLWPCADKVALDMAIGMCRKNFAHPMQTVCAAAELLPFSSERFDIVASNLMLQWVERPELFLEEGCRVIKPGGLLAVASFASGSLAGLERAFGTVSPHAHISPFLAAGRLQELAKNAGFSIIEAKTEQWIEAYVSVEALLHSLRAIGAGNKLTARSKGLMTPRLWKRMLSAYPKREDGIEAEWIVDFVIARKTQ